ncbi:hypothetical protein ACF3DV_14675 [Chlorogloeopsis fritschii PCC 9212]|uniref:Uncharacterized protein n=1 Tax=Chlorogloeopsis fritschii PCC 6912 TaxID=211165 RepID=A0A433NQU7_CHLFR|nr:hypothetical protein [Chlorogloeopsis fritschii]MBF2005029.1 hypothetical protein [Chlorogloeopsis fritschii C42_A2020_084]RUR86595.1 hypothetical protein PCC6912_00380 [Chlorogloeopsis fritschii PCC 6912]
MDKEFQNRLKDFTNLKSKYQATKHEDSSPSSLLYLILRKVDLGIELTDLELDWLTEHKLFETVKVIKQKQQHKVEELRKLESEFSHLKVQYKVPKSWQDLKDYISSPLYPILWKHNSEVEWLKNHQLTGSYQPSYQPYTLMGAIYYDKGEYPKGDNWFAEAIKRGARSEDIDDEIKRVVRSTKDENKRQDAARYLISKDSQRYAWAKSYLKKSKDKDCI